MDWEWNLYILSFSLTIIHTSKAAASAPICSIGQTAAYNFLIIFTPRQWIGNGIFMFSPSVTFSLTMAMHTSEAAASAPNCSKSIPFGNLRGGSDTVTKKSSESGSYSSIHDPPGYIAPDMQDLLLDVTHNALCSSIANLLDV
jgi:hypothetical protein